MTKFTEERLRKTEWFREYAKDAPGSSEEALKFALTERDFEIRKSTDTGPTLFVVVPKSDPEFWMDGLETRELAVSLCRAMGWSYMHVW